MWVWTETRRASTARIGNLVSVFTPGCVSKARLIYLKSTEHRKCCRRWCVCHHHRRHHLHLHHHRHRHQCLCRCHFCDITYLHREATMLSLAFSKESLSKYFISVITVSHLSQSPTYVHHYHSSTGKVYRNRPKNSAFESMPPSACSTPDCRTGNIVYYNRFSILYGGSVTMHPTSYCVRYATD